jgi:hypothetical protein
MAFKLRKIQEEKSTELVQILQKFRVGILSGEVRTGKTHTVLATANKLNKKNVLFLTKKKAISSIEGDFKTAGYDYNLIVINYQSLHKVDSTGVDLVICDESHFLSSFPKPSKYAKDVRQIVHKNKIDLILCSGTPFSESYSQIYHQLWLSFFTPFEEVNFYKWAKNYVDVVTMKINGFDVRQYKNADREKVMLKINPLMITMSQVECGFKSQVKEHFETVRLKPKTYEIIERLKRDEVVEGKNDVILGDTAVKRQQKLHQLYSGTCVLESGERIVIDTTKAEFIANKWKGQKIAIFYKFKAELNALKEVLNDSITENLDEFNSTDKSYVGQIVSSREGINLSQASVLVFYNIDFSSVSYWQSRDRLLTKDRLENNVYYIFAENGIETQIYKAVAKKKDFTLRLYKKWAE